MDDKIIKKPESIRQLVLSAAAYASGSIFGPLVIFGGIGYWLFKKTDSKLVLVISIFLAFVASNILIIRKTKQLTKKISESTEEKDKIK